MTSKNRLKPSSSDPSRPKLNQKRSRNRRRVVQKLTSSNKKPSSSRPTPPLPHFVFCLLQFLIHSIIITCTSYCNKEEEERQEISAEIQWEFQLPNGVRSMMELMTRPERDIFWVVRLRPYPNYTILKHRIKDKMILLESSLK